MCNDMCMATMIDVAMSGTRLFEALKAEARRTGDRELVRRWNERAFTLGAKLEREAEARKRGLPALAALGWV